MLQRYGRMANRLLLASTFVAHTEEYGDSLLVPGFMDYARFFQGTEHNPMLFYRSRNQQRHKRSGLIHYLNIKNSHDKKGEYYFLDQAEFLACQEASRILLVNGWYFRGPDALQKHKDIVRRLFTPVSRHQAIILRHAELLRHEVDHVIGVHIRRTDYEKYAGGKYFYPHEVYLRVMREIAGQLEGRTRFLLCSDAPIDLAYFSDLDVIAGTGHPVEDNYELATCDYIVGPPSTYSLWAAYYGGAQHLFIRTPDAPTPLSAFSSVDKW
jgi:hypothetical protein